MELVHLRSLKMAIRHGLHNNENGSVKLSDDAFQIGVLGTWMRLCLSL